MSTDHPPGHRVEQTVALHLTEDQIRALEFALIETVLVLPQAQKEAVFGRLLPDANLLLSTLRQARLDLVAQRVKGGA